MHKRIKGSQDTMSDIDCMDEYVMSDEEDMEISFETENSADEDNDIESLADLIERSRIFQELGDFKKGREIFINGGIVIDTNNNWEITLEIARCFLLELHNEYHPENSRNLIEETSRSIDNLLLYYNGVDKSRYDIIELLGILCPNHERNYLFQTDRIDNALIQEKFKFEETLLAKFRNLTDFSSTVNYYLRYIKIWKQKFNGETIYPDLNNDLRCLKEIDSDIPKDLVLRLTDFELQICIDLLLNQGSLNKIPKGEEDLNLLWKLTQKSLQLQQNQRIMLQLHFLLAFTNVDESQYHFRECLLLLGSTKVQYSEIFEKIIAFGVVGTTMIDPTSINPFDYEELQVSKSNDFIKLLQNLYGQFRRRDLEELHKQLEKINKLFNYITDSLMTKIFEKAQFNKLRENIIKVYEGISIEDLNASLYITTHSGLMSFLMRLRLQEKFSNFIIDFNKNIVIFTEPTSEPLKYSNRITDIELSTDTGIVMESNSNLGDTLTSAEYLDFLKQRRNETLNNVNSRLDVKYSELLACLKQRR